jgi:hypothetical protein
MCAQRRYERGKGRERKRKGGREVYISIELELNNVPQN